MESEPPPDGLVPTVAPAYPAFSGGFAYTPEWGAAAVIIPWQVYQWYGDRALLAGHRLNYNAVGRLGRKTWLQPLFNELFRKKLYRVSPLSPARRQIRLSENRKGISPQQFMRVHHGH